MKILMVTPEATPFAKTGGLGDVLGSLPAALAKLGDEVAVVIPRYRTAVVEGASRIWNRMPLWVGTRNFIAGIDQIVRNGVRYLFVDCPEVYDRAELYGSYVDNHIRFAVLNQAAIGIARGIFRPQIFHAHDWPTGLLGVYLRSSLAGDPTFLGSRVVFTIHNLGYHGTFPRTAVSDLGLDPGLFHPGGLEFWGELNFLKAGLVWADAITTVSPTYAREIQTPEQGFGLDGVLGDRVDRLSGILNGVDYDEWDPSVDRHLKVRYSSAELGGKRASKLALLEEMKLPLDVDRPLIGIVSRFAHQKGFDLLGEIAPWIAGQDVAWAVLGSGEAPLEQMFRDLAADNPDKFGLKIGFDNGLAHRIEAGSDMFLMPSRYEPCGLNQIYSLRYGTIPVVTATGGLKDTVDAPTGFKFATHTGDALMEALTEALAAYRERDAWTAMMRRGMAKDYSWDASAAEYQRLYQRTLALPI